MRKITKLRRSIKAISPVISVLLMIAIAVVASLVVYAWVMGYVGFQTNKVGNAVQIQSSAFSTDGTQLTVYVQNVGQGTEQLNYPDNTVYVNTIAQPIVSVNPDSMRSGSVISLQQGQTVGLTISYTYVPGQQLNIKIVTVGGTSAQSTGTSGSTGTDPGVTPQINLGQSSGSAGSTVTLSGSNFAASSTLTVKFDTTTATTSPATVTTTTAGSIPSGVTFTIPSGASSGSHTITVTDASSNFATSTFTVTVATSITVNPTSGTTGSTVTLSGTGFAASSTITFKFDTTTLTTTPTTVTSTAAGAIPSGVTFTVPSGASTGSHTVTATDASSNTASTTFTVSGPGTVTITFATSGVGSDTGSANIVTIDSTSYTYAQLQTPFQWTPGSTHTITAISPVSAGAGKQYVWTSWSATSFGTYTTSNTYTYTVQSNGETVTANYKIQLQMTFQQNGLSNDASGTVLTVGSNTYTRTQLPSGIWVDDGTTYSYSSTVSAGTGKQYAYTGVTGPTSPIHSSGTVVGSYKTQYQVTITKQQGTTTPTGTAWYDSGAQISISVTWSGNHGFNRWTSSTGSTTFGNSRNTSTTATITGADTITATFYY